MLKKIDLTAFYKDKINVETVLCPLCGGEEYRELITTGKEF